jgi:hypothetical protein
MRRITWGLAALALLGCDDEAASTEQPIDAAVVVDLAVGSDAAEADLAVVEDATPPDAAIEDATPPDQGPTVGPPRCNDGLGTLPEGVTTLAWDDGQGVGTVAEQTWTVVGEPLATADLHEAVRFDLPHPARIVGFSIQWGALPADVEAPLLAGLYGDFGYNGFDFWAPDPLWEGARCRGDVQDGAWTDYVLPTPVEIDHPGLVYVAHRRTEGDGAWLFDGTPPNEACEDDCCAPFEACHSNWNFPGLVNFTAGGQQNYAWNGLTTTFRYDYLVRLHVEYLDDVQPEETLFQPVAEVDPSNRMAWGDYDADGWADLVTNGPRLYHNEQGTLVDVSAAAFAGIEGLTGTGVWGDFDNDGCPDLFVFDEAYNRSDSLLRNNCDGTFEAVTALSTIADVQDYNRCDDEANDRTPSPAAGWVDLDNDGLLDLYVANFICWSAGQQYLDQVWRNNGDGTFTDLTGEHGFYGADDTRLASRGVHPIDHDQDGDVDVFVNNYRLHRNLFWRNNGDGTFTERAKRNQLAGRRTVQGLSETFGHSIGAAWGDLNEDGVWDVIVANLAHPRFWSFSSKTEVLIGQGDGNYRDIQGDWASPVSDTGLRYQETHSVPVLADFDHDGHLDLAISAIYPGRPSDFYWGNGDGSFRLDAYHAGITVTNGWGMAVADYDHDGDLDLAATRQMFENAGEAEGHWLQLALVGELSNRMALGATARAYVGDRVLLRHVSGGNGQGCQDSPYLHFGLGAAEAVDRVEVDFPGAGTVAFEGPFEGDRRHWLFESGATHSGWALPD